MTLPYPQPELRVHPQLRVIRCLFCNLQATWLGRSMVESSFNDLRRNQRPLNQPADVAFGDALAFSDVTDRLRLAGRQLFEPAYASGDRGDLGSIGFTLRWPVD